MIDEETARGIAEQLIASLPTNPALDLAILEDHTVEADFGWVFFYSAVDGRALARNAPIIVDRRDGAF